MMIRRLMVVVAIAAIFSTWLAHARDMWRDGDFGFVILLVETGVLCVASLPFVIAAHITRRDAAYGRSLKHRCEFRSDRFDCPSDANPQSL